MDTAFHRQMERKRLRSETQQEKTMGTQLAAISPNELQSAQSGVSAHCEGRLLALHDELKEARATLEQAKNKKWNTKPFQARVRRIIRKMEYFGKIQKAVENGYLIIPDVWNADIFAIRVRDRDRVKWQRYGNAQIEKLPIGKGEYVDARPIEHSRMVTDDKGNRHREVYAYETTADIDFPVSVVHPSVIEATDIAMADKIFDCMKIAKHGGDPFILGEICDPIQGYKSVCFFVAWFLDVSRL